ncbi:hypothetical protein BUALT_Bualt06G0146500 [Buddleja alternifolia]|uniref:NERD domain-containing protein n=1 Tax=Buddleja alternifolia TaxID=168488 RepID=A0AAV6XGU2_9LAMI|nr:hypothetical protein BUALT_Bualt06G0146500 [Buddleja alternifolia]
MWVELICGLVLYGLVKRFFFQDDALLDIDSSYSNALFAVAKRLEKLYHGSKVYVGLQIPDSDSASRQNIDLVLLTHQEAVVISVQNVSGFVSIDKDGNWMCTNAKNHKIETIPNPVMETKKLVSILEEYLEQRGVALPEGYLSCAFVHHDVACKQVVRKWAPYQAYQAHQAWGAHPWGPGTYHVLEGWGAWPAGLVRGGSSAATCSDLGPMGGLPRLGGLGRLDSFPPEVTTYDQWQQLKSEQKNSYSGWIKGALLGGKKKMQESFFEKLNAVLSTAPVWDRLELKGNKYILGEFVEFKGKQEDLQALRKIRRSKVSRVTVQKISMFGFAHSTVQVLYAHRDYRVEGSSSSSSQWEEVTVRSSTEVVFQPQNSKKPRKYKLSSVISMSLSA